MKNEAEILKCIRVTEREIESIKKYCDDGTYRNIHYLRIQLFKVRVDILKWTLDS